MALAHETVTSGRRGARPWTTDEYEDAHAGYAGAVLAGGAEPETVYIDVGSGTSLHSTKEWWAYTGRHGRPTAVAFRGAYSCGWRGTAHPIDWIALTQAGEDLHGLDTSPPIDDWNEHIAAVDQRTVPLPSDVHELLEKLRARLEALANDHPAAALRATSTIERIAADTGRLVAFSIDPDETPDWADQLAQDLGITATMASSRARRYALTPW